MKSFYLILTAAVISFASCRAKEGEPGPAGQSALKQQGAISGTIAFTNTAGHDTTVTFSFQYFSSITENTFFYQNGSNTYYGFNFKRRDLQDQNCYINLNGSGSGAGDTENDPYNPYMEFSFLKVINGDLYEFSRNNFPITITNITLDPVTGRLTCDFSGTVYYGSNDDEATVTGKVNVILNREGSSGKQP